jgi:hypothetical protein
MKRTEIGTAWCWKHEDWKIKIVCECGQVDTACCIARSCASTGHTAVIA